MIPHLTDLPGEWVARAACNVESAEEFFRGSDSGTPTKEPSAAYAKAICNSPCPVKQECFAWVMADDERRIARRERPNEGVWAATTKRERERLRNR